MARFALAGFLTNWGCRYGHLDADIDRAQAALVTSLGGVVQEPGVYQLKVGTPITVAAIAHLIGWVCILDVEDPRHEAPRWVWHPRPDRAPRGPPPRGKPVAVSRAPGDTGTPHADTHGQAEPVFGPAALLGIKLLPRMRTWQDVTFYRVDRETTYQYIDALLAQVVDWDLIERHWQEMMQVVLSIQASRVLPSMLLQKLGVYSPRNALYKAFCELGRVERTIFLLESMSIQPCGSISARRPRKSNLTISLPRGWRLVDRSCAVGNPWSRRSGSSIEIWWLTP